MVVDALTEKYGRPDIILTVDNGMGSVEGVARANQLGIRVIVTDHHLPGEYLPAAACIVNPNGPDGAGAPGNLAGVGVIFYVLIALRAELRARGAFAAGSSRSSPSSLTSSRSEPWRTLCRLTAITAFLWLRD